MKKVILIILLLTIIVFFSPMAWAGRWSVEDYKKLKKTKPMQEFIHGVGRGLFVGNVIMGKETGKRLFCLPGNFALERDNFILILDHEIERWEKSVGFEKAQEDSIDQLLLFGLMETFPCK